jgi:hypothetical protein
MDVYERRELFKDLEAGIVTPAHIGFISKENRSCFEDYGELQIFHVNRITGNKHRTIQVEEVDSRGYQMCGGWHGLHVGKEVIPYWITESWCNPGSVIVEEAYRIFEESEEILKVRKVQDVSELRSLSELVKRDMAILLR